ncbi:MAG TPA: MarR family transcriptional regulator [Nocardioidaceae bacterium]|nr:MarR family transcriptional regulator [Nocardioidaceae bacterium]
MQPSSPASPEEAVYLFAAQLGRMMRKRQTGDEVDVGSWPVLHMLQCHGDLRLSDLAAKLHLDASTVSRHVRQLEDRGLVERTDDPDDRRAARVRGTDTGHKALEQGRQRRRDQIAQVLAQWPEADVHAFAAFASRFTDDLDHILDPEGAR